MDAGDTQFKGVAAPDGPVTVLARPTTRLGRVAVDFNVTGPELLAHLRRLSDRYARAVA